MAAPLDVSIPPGLVLDGGYIVSFTAVDATTGAVVNDVIVSGATVQFDQAPPPSDPVKNDATFLPGPAFS